MKIVAKGIGVDSGTIFLADKSYYAGKNNKEFQHPCDLGKEFEVPNGTYQVLWEMPNTWNGKVTGTGVLIITSGILSVSDPCYHIRDKEWTKLLKATDFFQTNIPDGIVLLDKHGGDGCFTVKITLVKI